MRGRPHHGRNCGGAWRYHERENALERITTITMHGRRILRGAAVLLAAAVMLAAASRAALAQTQPLKVNPETGETQEQFVARTAWWREAKFGMFIHWGLYAVPADSTQGLGEWYFNNHTD